MVAAAPSLSVLPVHQDDPAKFQLPDLVSHCIFPLNYHPNGDTIAAASDRWLDKGCPEFTDKARKAVYGLKAGVLTAHCYPFCDDEHLRVVSDFMGYLFHLDNISDSMDNSGTVSTREVVIGTLRNPRAFKTTARVGVMTRE